MLSPLLAEIEAVSRHMPGHSVENAVRYAEQEGLDTTALLLDVVGDDSYSDEVRWIACWSLFWIGGTAQDALIQACCFINRAERLKRLLTKKLGALPNSLETLQHGSLVERLEVLDNDDFIYSRQALPHIIEALYDDDPRIRAAASLALLVLADDGVVGPENVSLEQLTRVVKELDRDQEPDIRVIMIYTDAFRQMGVNPPDRSPNKRVQSDAASRPV